MDGKVENSHISRLSALGVIISLGIVYGDIGTSPLYVMKSIVEGMFASGVKQMNEDIIYGALSCIIWTLTLQTTIKYVIITLKADNKGEGGIFSLYALIRKKKKGVFIFAIIGGSALVADGIITPSITVVSAIEGLEIPGYKIPVLPIVFIIITALFFFQQFGTHRLGRSFGPIMFFWFLTLGILGMSQIIEHPGIFRAFSPHYAIALLSNYPGAFVLLGAVFLCTTGAEALYSDLGHCGLKNIRISWGFVKISLILNYLGQGAWILSHPNEVVEGINPFFSIMPDWFHFFGVILATAAAIIASQALISGSFTIFSEAIFLNFWPKIKIVYPSNIKGQMYIPTVNWFLYFGCLFVVFYFQKSSAMEAAYGLSITITMLMTTFLMMNHLRIKKRPLFVVIIFIIVYSIIEGGFLIANFHKFSQGGWFTIAIGGLLSIVMYVWFTGRNIKKRFTQFIKISNYFEIIKDLQKDVTIPKYATNLVYTTSADYNTDIESKVIYSIINKQPKRADLYWIIHVHILDEPNTTQYVVEPLITNVLYRIDLRIGFKVDIKINQFFRQVVEDMVKNSEIDITSRYPSLKKHRIVGDFKFVIIDRILTYDIEFSAIEQLIMDIYEFISVIKISDAKAFGLDTSNVVIETVPLSIKTKSRVKLERIEPVTSEK